MYIFSKSLDLSLSSIQQTYSYIFILLLGELARFGLLYRELIKFSLVINSEIASFRLLFFLVN